MPLDPAPVQFRKWSHPSRDQARFTLSYLTRMLRLTLLAPDNVAAILDGRQGPDVTLALLMEPVPAEWTEQFQSLVAA
ncbi:hypothetical protein HOY34_20755 [Xinfangfangia sp. D13-10-4-6]|uniref:hypothetical protein n=1 Tax=Pseudogemmobacter hezensis TaxID=2737662 RepID=UPI0015568855|nr:hypothetical protein [Pseudogemmobacter hezensis]NPD17620.1 hypothetical protein [Pseudogemmobacter hezensis]